MQIDKSKLYFYWIKTVDKASNIANIEFEAIPYEFRLYPFELTLKELTNLWVERIKVGSYKIIMCSYLNEDVAFIAYEITCQNCANIRTLYIKPKFFRQKIGSILVKLVENQLKKQGIREILLEVEPLNNSAQEFYRSLQFIKSQLQSSHLLQYKKVI